MRSRRRTLLRGVALTELVIWSVLLLLVTGMVVPAVNEQIAVEARGRALGDLRHIAADVLNYRRDTGLWPDGGRFAFTNGSPAVGEDVTFGRESEGIHVAGFLAVNERAVPKWRGPYMGISRPDPWGQRYVLLLEGLRGPTSPHGWLLSAGPDGILQTGLSDRGVQGDDLGLRLR